MGLSRSIGSRYDGALGATALDARLDLAGMLAHTNAASPAIRAGVFPGCNPALVTGTAGWNYQLDVADFATSRGASDGAHIFGNGGVLTVATDAAPGTAGASRWDVLYMLHPSKGENADTSSTPVFGVAKGNPIVGAPVVPAIPTGALELARNLMTSAATSTSSAGNTLTQTWRYTALRGCPIVVRNSAERDELNTLATATNPVIVDRLDTGTLERNTGSGWAEIAAPRARMRLTRSTGQTVANGTPATVNFDTADTHGTASMWAAGAPAAIIVPFAGWYTCSANLGFATNASGYRVVWITAGATRIAEELVSAVPGAPTQVSVSTTVWLPAGTQLVLYCYQTSGAPLDINTSEVLPTMSVVSA